MFDIFHMNLSELGEKLSKNNENSLISGSKIDVK